MKEQMQFAGTLNSEEAMFGKLSGGRIVFVEMLSVYFDAPEGEREDPEYWEDRVLRGGFGDAENAPMAWIQERR